MKYSILYMIFEGLSKGGNHVLLLFVASTIDPSIYLTIMLLISFETLLPIFVITNYNEVLYSIKDRFDKEKVFSTIMTLTTLMSLVYMIGILIIKSYLYKYFEYNNLVVYLIISFNIFFFVFFRFISVFYQLEEKHSQAIYLKSLPFFLSFIGVLCGVLLFEDKIAGFFIGKLLGYIVAFVIFLAKNKIFRLDFKIDKDFLIQYINRAKFLILLGVFGWLSGYGFLNFGKVFSTPQDTIKFGYMLNIFMLYLMIANGINQIYAPKIRGLFDIDIKSAYLFSKKVAAIYLGISLVSLLLYKAIIIYIDQNYMILNLNIKHIIAMFPYSVLIFYISSFKYISDVYIYLQDIYKDFVYRLMTVEVIVFILVIGLLNFYPSLLIPAYILIIVSRSFVVYKFARLKLLCF